MWSEYAGAHVRTRARVIGKEKRPCAVKENILAVKRDLTPRQSAQMPRQSPAQQSHAPFTIAHDFAVELANSVDFFIAEMADKFFSKNPGIQFVTRAVEGGTASGVRAPHAASRAASKRDSAQEAARVSRAKRNARFWSPVLLETDLAVPRRGTQQCQRCLERGHWTYECKAPAKVYVSRTSQSRILRNPQLRPSSQDLPPDQVRRQARLERWKRHQQSKRGKVAKRGKRKKKSRASSSSSDSDSSSSDSDSSSSDSDSSSSDSSDSSSGNGKGNR